MASEAPLPQDFVLLVNATAVKGYDLILDVAALLPRIPFVCIASQSSVEAAEAVAAERGLANVHVIDRTDDMATLYRAARVVAVPSYQFIETFSRVCIEAHRFGKPVLGSNVGNVPFLLERSGFVLPPDPRAWGLELTRLYEDAGYYDAASAAALRNSAAYPYDQQRRAILGVLAQAQASVLIGLGSGIGNMLHVSPLVRRIAEHVGHPVDLLVSEDHSASLFLLHNPAYVNAVYPLRRFALARRYETIFITHSFGAASPPLRAGRVLRARDWALFSPDNPLHEAMFNLEAAKQLLGVDYAPEDAARSYVGEYDYRWPAGNLVGVHGGSKPGKWMSKRWPGYPELAAWLVAKGYRVASFGTPDEYVEGTEDMTGGTVRQMTEWMLDCSYFVSNDSGVMNIANSLGIPLLAVFGPTNVATRGPLRSTSRSVCLMKSCAPCECVDPKRFVESACGCIAEIPVDHVAEAFESLVRDVAQ